MCGKVGASRAIDYAVVDLALVCYTSFLSNVEMLEREGVDRAQLYARRLGSPDTQCTVTRTLHHTNPHHCIRTRVHS